MTKFRLFAGALALALFASLISPASTRASTFEPFDIASSDAITERMISELENGAEICPQVPTIYQFDCYRQAFQAAAAAVGSKPDYRDARRALSSVATDLNKIVRKEQDKTQPKIKVGNRSYKAIKSESIPASTAVFEASRDEAATVLLRSNDAASAAYTRVASVVGSSKILYRAQLQLLRRMAGLITIAG
ncbi:MAG: hypothetical protein CML68_17715 [Rhodobacteraceae bacterium]|nr:hypothetical protein [Paracoccaceae bacterium]